MDEERWLCCSSPDEMLEFVRSTGTASERRIRPFAVARCRRIWHPLRDERSQHAMEVAEAFLAW